MGLAKEHRSRGVGKEPPMKKRANASEPAQVGAELLFTAQQLLLPMIEGIIYSRGELLGWV
jgi:hypothetical protein